MPKIVRSGHCATYASASYASAERVTQIGDGHLGEVSGVELGSAPLERLLREAGFNSLKLEAGLGLRSGFLHGPVDDQLYVDGFVEQLAPVASRLLVAKDADLEADLGPRRRHPGALDGPPRSCYNVTRCNVT